MDLSNHNLQSLFAQLGLDNRPDSIDQFIERHKGLPARTRLEEANFWTPAQASFLKESINQDSDWCEVVDVLDSMLR
ncbi:DUF2789 domain-containing protein [Thalassotalea mangrovi]|uniref:DUF2789 domain-containing protein n=1 Tax=Thalassotalea mangrovi TaxID=2572245 RepID=A0A4U1B359_9GAMM|nr:DUF2789 domain-containing protein [Thalassotalea mangrovi]TKB43526.1 DUF2789 domain-containing protein [Thalassotalea mangrovi]